MYVSFAAKVRFEFLWRLIERRCRLLRFRRTVKTMKRIVTDVSGSTNSKKSRSEEPGVRKARLEAEEWGKMYKEEKVAYDVARGKLKDLKKQLPVSIRDAVTQLEATADESEKLDRERVLNGLVGKLPLDLRLAYSEWLELLADLPDLKQSRDQAFENKKAADEALKRQEEKEAREAAGTAQEGGKRRAGSAEEKRVKDVCAEVLENTKCLEVVQLPVFEAYAYTFPRIEATESRLAPEIPGIPGDSVPNMLLLGVQDEEHKNKEVYKWILSSSTKGPSSMYGTSGCGKSRSIMEFLSHNYGFYFSAAVVTGVADQGSDDMAVILQAAANNLEDVAPGKRYDVVVDHLRVLVLARLAVFEHVAKIMKRVPTAYEWLLVQLYPRYFFGKDVFAVLSETFLLHCTAKDVQGQVGGKLNNARHLFHNFVDESQHLFAMCPNMFPSGKDQTNNILNRAMYSAVTKGFMRIGLKNGIEVGLTFPVMTGTGVSYEQMMHAIESAMAKETLPSYYYAKEFTAFPPQSPEQVQTYMQTVANLTDMGDTFVKHTTRWLAGRPRWAATFLSLWMRGALPPASARLSQSRVESTSLLIALDAYLVLMTTEQSKEGNPLVVGTPYTYVDNVERMWATEEGSVATRMRMTVYSALVKFAVTGEGQLVSEGGHKLIRAGLCAYDVNGMDVMLTEPLIVEAALNRLDLETFLGTRLLDTASNSSTSGFMFEDYSILPIRNNFLHALSKGELGIEYDKIRDEWKRLTKIGSSSYGVLAVRCTTAKQVMDWLHASVDSTLDGQVAPFCFPDEKMGPDLLFFLRDPNDWDSWRLTMWQHKFTNTTNQAAAMRTVDPDLLYHEKRDTSPVPALKGDDLKAWETIRTKLFGGISGARPPMSVLLQYPAKVTRSSKSTQEEDGRLRLGIGQGSGVDKIFVSCLPDFDQVKLKHTSV